MTYSVVFAVFMDGVSIQKIADAYGVSPKAVEDAIRKHLNNKKAKP